MDFADEELDQFMLVLLRRQRKRNRGYWVHPMNLIRPSMGEHLKLEMMYSAHPKLFFEYTRLSPIQFDKVLGFVTPHITRQDTNYRSSISPRIRLQVTMRFLASGDSMMSIATSFSLGRSTVCNIINETARIIWDTMSPVHMKELTQEEWLEVVNDFEQTWNFPNCLGAIDGKHVVIQAPGNSGSLYFNYKNTFSIVLLATCDAKYRFTTVDIGAYGRQSDGGILSQSVLGKKLENGTLPIPGDRQIRNSSLFQPCTFVGDDAFALSSFMLKPYPSTRIDESKKRIFNYRLSRARRIIENCFGILSSRFRIYRKVLLTEPENACNIVKATVLLHNFLRNEDIELDDEHKQYCPANFVDTHDEENGLWSSAGPSAFLAFQRSNKHNYTATAKKMRDNLADYFTTGGSAPWQLERSGLASCN